MTHVLWSPQAEESFDCIISYLIANWNTKIASSFKSDTNDLIHQITQFPQSFPSYEKLKGIDYRKAVINKQVTLFYSISSTDQIILHLFWNNRQDPKKLQKIIQKDRYS